MKIRRKRTHTKFSKKNPFCGSLKNIHLLKETILL